jgi:hypothetical protein
MGSPSADRVIRCDAGEVRSSSQGGQAQVPMGRNRLRTANSGVRMLCCRAGATWSLSTTSGSWSACPSSRCSCGTTAGSPRCRCGFVLLIWAQPSSYWQCLQLSGDSLFSEVQCLHSVSDDGPSKRSCGVGESPGEGPRRCKRMQTVHDANQVVGGHRIQSIAAGRRCTQATATQPGAWTTCCTAPMRTSPALLTWP